jgi:2-methylisocitrate lyase-like PEP mutase family enzyme
MYACRNEYNAQFGEGMGPLILARTDALKTDGFEAAIERCLAFRELGVDMTFLEAPESIEQMKEYNRRVGGATLANMLEQGSTPVLPPKELKKLGYTMAAYPLTLLSASIKAMNESLERIKNGIPTDDMILSCEYGSMECLMTYRELALAHLCFPCSSSLLIMILSVPETKDAVGFTKYAEEEDRYKAD